MTSWVWDSSFFPHFRVLFFLVLISVDIGIQFGGRVSFLFPFLLGIVFLCVSVSWLFCMGRRYVYAY